MRINVDMYGNCIWSNYMYVDLDGNPVKKTKDEYPYSYDPYVVWKGDYDKEKISNVVYSDRLWEWDSKKYNECCQEVWNNHGQYFYNREPEDIERFLSKYFRRNIKLTVILEGCNVSNGYPVWVFYYE